MAIKPANQKEHIMLNYTQGTIKLSDGSLTDVITYHNSCADSSKAAKRMKKSGQYVNVWFGDQGGRTEV